MKDDEKRENGSKCGKTRELSGYDAKKNSY